MLLLLLRHKLIYCQCDKVFNCFLLFSMFKFHESLVGLFSCVFLCVCNSSLKTFGLSLFKLPPVSFLHYNKCLRFSILVTLRTQVLICSDSVVCQLKFRASFFFILYRTFTDIGNFYRRFHSHFIFIKI